MEKRTINTLITVCIIAAVLSLSIYIIIRDNASSPSQLTEELAKCIGQNSVLYVQTGCPACQKQEELFGKYLSYINLIDCFLKENRQICINEDIQATPTWMIDGRKYKGIQSISTLKGLTNC